MFQISNIDKLNSKDMRVYLLNSQDLIRCIIIKLDLFSYAAIRMFMILLFQVTIILELLHRIKIRSSFRVVGYLFITADRYPSQVMFVIWDL